MKGQILSPVQTIFPRQMVDLSLSTKSSKGRLEQLHEDLRRIVMTKLPEKQGKLHVVFRIVLKHTKIPCI